MDSDRTTVQSVSRRIEQDGGYDDQRCSWKGAHGSLRGAPPALSGIRVAVAEAGHCSCLSGGTYRIRKSLGANEELAGR